ncbi:hypothetical protein CANCADRAFT_127709 [Tortispora caseinolytica NRRL Y-17796]|uniref:Zn(2)-C6 fungal-type domain-containing protein n=1 Tax=Tortispora caseinolytica NRRL Y-17796 TaxID=767744 RepID=A0A1E4TAD9_9ASCO|nr:hypothetical protein CANCADRAFT_127709 [Tortispora caseinolytica NRRL Y-17796]
MHDNSSSSQEPSKPPSTQSATPATSKPSALSNQQPQPHVGARLPPMALQGTIPPQWYQMPYSGYAYMPQMYTPPPPAPYPQQLAHPQQHEHQHRLPLQQQQQHQPAHAHMHQHPHPYPPIPPHPYPVAEYGVPSSSHNHPTYRMYPHPFYAPPGSYYYPQPGFGPTQDAQRFSDSFLPPPQQPPPQQQHSQSHSSHAHDQKSHHSTPSSVTPVQPPSPSAAHATASRAANGKRQSMSHSSAEPPLSPSHIPLQYPGPLGPMSVPGTPVPGLAMHPMGAPYYAIPAYATPPGIPSPYGNNQSMRFVLSVPSRRTHRKRTKTGCLTCRQRRIKCDEGRPVCSNCTRSHRKCLGYVSLNKPAGLQHDQTAKYESSDDQEGGPLKPSSSPEDTDMESSNPREIASKSIDTPTKQNAAVPVSALVDSDAGSHSELRSLGKTKTDTCDSVTTVH